MSWRPARITRHSSPSRLSRSVDRRGGVRVASAATAFGSYSLK